MTSKLFLIVEDHSMMAQMIAKSLQKLEPESYCVIAENISQAKERLKLETPNLITVDLMFKERSGKNSGQEGLHFLDYILEEYPQLNILVYSTEPTLLKSTIKKAQSHLGSFAVLDKQQPPKDFLNKASMILDNPGLKLIPSELTQKSVNIDSLNLSEREIEILQLACQECLTDNLIGERLAISRRTVQNSMQRIREKLDILTDKSDNDMRLLMCNKAKEKGIIN